MAKKRVHEIAKERGISSKEVIAQLQSAGFDVKAAASSVDEGDIATAFDGAPRQDATPVGEGGGEPSAPEIAGPAEGAATATATEPATAPPDAAPSRREPTPNGGPGARAALGRADRAVAGAGAS
jgi:translation initiation factor IF-2